MRRGITIGFVVLLAAGGFAQSRAKRIAPVDSGQRSAFSQAKIAVVVGVGAYPPRSGLSELRYPAGDVDALGGMLEAQGYTVVPLKDADATRPAILRAVRNIGEVVERGQGTVVFFFSGHGFAVGGRNYLATYESTALNLSQSGLALEDLEEQLQSTGAQRRILWIDACRNQPGKGVADARSFSNFQAAAGTRILFSTKAGKLSYENDDLRHGVFTHFLLEGLRGGAAGGDGLVTFRDLADYVSTSVRDYSLKRGDVQVPYDAGEAAGDFLVAGAISTPLNKSPENTAGGATLLIDSDMDATFTLDGQPGVALKAGQMRSLPLAPGGHILQATSGSVSWRKVVDLHAGEQQAVMVDLAKRIEGTWTTSEDYSGTHNSRVPNTAYSGKRTYSLQIFRSGDGFKGIWHNELKEKDIPDGREWFGGFDATFRLTIDGDKLAGMSESGRDLTFKEDLPRPVPFTGTLEGPDRLKVEIIWSRDLEGKVMEFSRAVLQKGNQ